MQVNTTSGVRRQCDDDLRLAQRFSIPAHIHVCVTGDGSVVLDVQRDKYLGLGREETEILADSVSGWPQPLWPRKLSSEKAAVSRATRQICEPLVEDGVLERIAEGQLARVMVSLNDMHGEWISIGDEMEIRGRLSLRHTWNFVAAYMWARWSLGLRPFSAVVEAIEAGKRDAVRMGAAWHPNVVAELVDVFRQLRPLVFAAEGRCLLHAVTLMRFLCRYGLGPEWVIGVATQPWGAHSWVQWGNFLLDSNPEKVCAFTPIMVV